jgi:hypothetical protein
MKNKFNKAGIVAPATIDKSKALEGVENLENSFTNGNLELSLIRISF